MAFTRRHLLRHISFLVVACRSGQFAFAAAPRVPVTSTVVARYVDIANPEKHCTQNHDHSDNSFDDWQAALQWASTNCGHNEGAAAVIKVAVNNGLSYPELMRGCQETEGEISQVDEIMKNPDSLDRLAWKLTPEQVAAIKQAIRSGKSFTEILVMAPDDAVGEVWRRKAMIRFAKSIATKGKPAPAAAIAIASQWHNCHAFRCLLRHADDVSLRLAA
jgi:hypothetical protein